MKKKNAQSQGNGQEYVSARRKIFWLGVRAESLMVSVVALLIGLAGITIIRLKNGGLSPMTEKDIEVFSELDFKYTIPFCWNLLFGIVWALMLYWILMSPWLRKEMGKTMRNIAVALIIFFGLYFSIHYSGMLYGLIVSCAFVTLLIITLLLAVWMPRILF